MSSKRQQIVEAIEARLKLIRIGQTFQLPDGPYQCQNNIQKVVSWHKSSFNPHELPAIEFWDADADTEAGPSSQHEHFLKVILQVSTPGLQPASVARSLMEDIVASIGSDPRWGGLAQWTDITAHGLMIEKAGDVIAGAQILFTVRYRTALWRL